MIFIYKNLKINRRIKSLAQNGFFLVLLFLLSTFSGFGQVLAGWNVNDLAGGTNNFGPSPFAATSVAPNLSVGGIVRGSGIGTTGSGGADAWGGNGFDGAMTLEAAITAGEYVTFTLSPDNGYLFSISGIQSYNIRRSGTGPTTGQWQYSFDGLAFTNIGSAITWGSGTTGTGNVVPAIDLTSITALQDVAFPNVVTFRIVTWGATGTGGTWYINRLAIDPHADPDLVITGTVEEDGPVSGPCTLQIVSINESECIPTLNDTFPNGYFLYDVEIIYSGTIPETGFLNLIGGEGASVPVGSLSGGTYTFVDQRGPSGNMSFNVTAFFSDNSGCLSVGLVEPPEGCSFPEGSCEELFFSEYLEGSSGNNKCVEIYNPTASTIDLAAGQYRVVLYANGAVVPTSTMSLTGTIPPFGAYLLCNSASVQDILLLADQTTSSLTHNGDDALALVKGALNDTLDIFGSIGQDPGTAWVDGTVTTLDRVLRRKPSVLGGVTTNPIGFVTLASEWDVYSDTTYSNFGIHESACTPPIPECPIVDLSVYPEDYNFELCGEGEGPVGVSCFTCNDNGTPDPSDDFFEYYVEVGYNDKPEGGYLIISVNGVDIDSLQVGEMPFPEGTEYVTLGTYTHPANGMNFTVEVRFDEIILCNVSSDELAPGPCSALPPCEELFFSEYIEGSGNNKCLEVYNPTGAEVDLLANDYQILMYFNGGGAPGLTINLTGTIPAYGTYVVCNSSATLEFRSLANQQAGGGWYNGDDAVSLSKGGINIDIIGQIGFDPGTEWANAGVSTVNQTIRRKTFITFGDPNGTDAFDPSLEWDTYPIDESFGLRFHRSDCNFNPDGLVTTQVGGCDGEVQPTEDGYNISSSCWGDMIGREATFLTTDICGNFDFSAKVTVTPFGFAGLMFRETLAPDTRYVYQFVRGNNQASWAVRSNPGLPVQVQTVPQINRQYLRMQRVGNLFRGYLSVNGIVWNQVHQSSLSMDSCGYVGFATHSGSDGVVVNSTYTDINASFIGEVGRPEFKENAVNDLFVKSQDFKVYPNPASQYLDIQLSGSEWTEREISIIDINGRLAFYQKSETSNIVKIDLQSANLTDGVYIIQIKDAEGFYQTRFVKAAQ
jgi:hypothetical protein